MKLATDGRREGLFHPIQKYRSDRMDGAERGDRREMETRIVGLYDLLYEDELSRDEINLYELTEPDYEGEIYLPDIGLNFELWAEWSTEKRIEVLIHEFAHTTNYDDDHHPSFWDRVVDLTQTVIQERGAVEALFDDFDPERLKRTVVDSVHEGVIEADVDTVTERKRAVAGALGVEHAETRSE